MSSTDNTYVAGVCNIGPAEITQRRRVGWVGLAVTVLAWAAFFVFHVAAPWRFFLFIPAALGASGFLQAAFHFCAGFGMRGVFNFGDQVGKTNPVESEESKRKDRGKSNRISAYSAAIGVVVALAGFFIV